MKPHELLDRAARLLEAGLLKEAQRACRKALQARPDLVEAHLMMSEVHRLSGDVDKARACAAQAQRLADASAPAPRVLANLGHVWAGLGRPAEAAASYRRALARDPALHDARDELLRVLRAGGSFAEMEALAREGMQIHPASVAYPRQLGVALWWQDRHEDAALAFEGIDRVGAEPRDAAYLDAKLDQAWLLLLLGRWREGWAAYGWRALRHAWREQVPGLVDDPRTVAGAPPGRVLIVGEQGLGDELFFLRFAPRLRAAGHRLYGRFDRKLPGLLARVPHLFERVLAADDPAPLPAELTLLSGDLPLASATDFAPPLMLAPLEERRARYAARLRQFGPPPYVGVTWRGGALPDEQTVAGRVYLTKQVAPEALGAALRPLAATIVLLQRRPAPEDVQRFSTALGRASLDLSAVNDDLEDALALLSLLDDYVCVSNANAHLRAGCAGATARVLVHHQPEWRWGLHSPRSPWFPQFHVYRQDARDDWSPALEAVTSDLLKALAA